MIVIYFGPFALLAFLLQAVAAVRKLEAVNYFQHWGLQQTDKSAAESWDTDSWFTLHTMLGLSHHADHHRSDQTAYQKLRYSAKSPRLPYGYYGMVFLAVFMNHTFQRLAVEELRRRRLGPLDTV